MIKIQKKKKIKSALTLKKFEHPAEDSDTLQSVFDNRYDT